MELNRRDFLKLSGAGIGAALAVSVAGGKATLAAPRVFPLKKKVKETTTICCFCGAGCGAIVSAYEDGRVKIEGDPDHPINQGVMCPKGLAMSQLHQVDGGPNPRRLTKPLYRAPGGTSWQEKSWDWTLGEIARRVKKTRDENWVEKDKDGVTVNRTEAIAQLGGAAHDNEECYLLTKMARALGFVYLEHQARI